MVELVLMVSAFASTSTDTTERILLCWHLTLMQNKKLTELLDQITDVFPSTPGLTHLVHHEIITPLGVVVIQQLYLVLYTHRQATEKDIINAPGLDNWGVV